MGRTRSPCCKSKDQIALAIDMNCLDVSAINRKASSWAKVCIGFGLLILRREICIPTLWTKRSCKGWVLSSNMNMVILLYDERCSIFRSHTSWYVYNLLASAWQALIFAKSNCTKIKVEFQSPRSKTKYKQNQKGVTSQKCEIVTCGSPLRRRQEPTLNIQQCKIT